MTASKTKIKEKLFTHVADYDNSIYHHNWQIVFTNNLKQEITETLKSNGATEKEIKHHLPYSKNVCAQVTNVKLKNGKSWNLVIFDINRYTNNTGVHEAFHVVKDILFPRGMEIDKTASSEEPYAYLLGNVFDAIHITYKVALIKYKEFKKQNNARTRDNDKKSRLHLQSSGEERKSSPV